MHGGLLDQLAVGGNEDAALTLAESGVGCGRLGDGDGPGGLVAVVLAEETGEGAGFQAQDVLQLRVPAGMRRVVGGEGAA